MAEQHLVLCGGLRRADAPRAWWRAHQVTLEIGCAADVHLAFQDLTERMSAGLPDVAHDLLDVAAFAYAADQAVTRGGTVRVDYGDGWRRWFRFEIPVRAPAVWNRPDVREALAGALEFLTDDVYEFGFHAADRPTRSQRRLFEDDPGAGFDAVALFSGGLDSLCGAVEDVLRKGQRVVLVSHQSSTRVLGRQRELFNNLRAHVSPGAPEPVHVVVTVNKDEGHNRDFAQRGRSFLFASIAAVAARLAHREGFRFYENGVTSLNLPISPELVGARASRTTHPQTLARFGRFFSRLFDVTFTVENPYQWCTKAEMVQRLRERADLAALTCSCGHVWGAKEEHPHCGRCSQCIDRRMSVLAAGLADATDTADPVGRYASDPLTGEREGAELTLAERYVGVAREVARLATPRAFAVRFPEVNAALGYAGCPTEEALRLSYELHRRHAAGVESAIRNAFARVPAFDWGSLPPCSLLGIVQGRAASPPRTEAATVPAPERGFVVDRDQFQVRYNGVPCPLRDTLEFAFVERLSRARGVYLSHRVLGEDVWGDTETPKINIQRVVSSLRRHFTRAGFVGVEIDGSNHGHYRLQLPTT